MESEKLPSGDLEKKPDKQSPIDEDGPEFAPIFGEDPEKGRPGEQPDEWGEEYEGRGQRMTNEDSPDPYVREEKEEIEDPDFTRHSYEYARSQESAPRRRLSRHNSAITTLSQIRSRVSVRPTFSHPLTQQKTGPDVIVDFDGPNDPYNPLNWPLRKKIITTAMYGATTAGITFASAVYSAGIAQIAEDFGVSEEVSVLGITMVLLGFGLGPLLWAPLSEVYGRKPAIIFPYFIAGVFSFGTATAKDLQTVMLTRFFAGFFGAAPVSNVSGALGDIWRPQQRGMAVALYALAVVGGPSLGPLIGGAVVQSYLRWRWTEYLSGILIMFIVVVDFIVLDESFHPVLLVYKARRLRHESGNWALHARHEEWDVSIRDLSRKYLVRPFQMMGTPICLLIAIYSSFVYGILYANLSAFPIEFQEMRGWNQVVGALPFIALLIGQTMGAGLNMFNQKFYQKAVKKNNGKPVPEARLRPMMIGGVLFAAGLFLFAWTSNPNVHWIGPVIGCALIGLGFTTVFQGAMNYLVDTFTKYAASAIAANTFLRSMFAAAFPTFVTPMYHNLGINWAASLFGFVAIAMIPIPFLFYLYGQRIRARGKWSKESTM